MTAFEAPGSSGFGRWRVDPATGEVFFDPGNPGGWPVGVSTDNAHSVVRDAAGRIAFAELQAEVTRVSTFNPAQSLIDHFGSRLLRAYSVRDAGGAFTDLAGTAEAVVGGYVLAVKDWVTNTLDMTGTPGTEPLLIASAEGVNSLQFQSLDTIRIEGFAGSAVPQLSYAADVKAPTGSGRYWDHNDTVNLVLNWWGRFSNFTPTRFTYQHRDPFSRISREHLDGTAGQARTRQVVEWTAPNSGDVNYWENGVYATHNGPYNTAYSAGPSGLNPSGPVVFFGTAGMTYEMSRFAMVAGDLSTPDVAALDSWLNWP